MRYPSPPGDPRRGTCPRCDRAAELLESYPPPHDHPTTGNASVAIVGVLDNVRSALNVGTMLRAADGGRLRQLDLCGLTPEGDHPKVVKTALGAESSVRWRHHLDATGAVTAWKDAGWVVWAVESTTASRPLADVASAGLPSRLVLVVGNERAGVDPALLELADEHVHLPMHGIKTTLNVGVAFGAAIYAVRTAESMRRVI